MDTSVSIFLVQFVVLSNAVRFFVVAAACVESFLSLAHLFARPSPSDLKISPGKSSRRDGRHRSLTHLTIRSAEPCVRCYRNASLVLLRVRAELDDVGDGAKTPRRISSSVRSRGARVRVAVSQSRD